MRAPHLSPYLSMMFLLLGMVCAPAYAAEKNAGELQQQADQSSGKECAHLSMQTSRQRLEDANRLFGSGEVKAAHQAVDDSLHYAGRAVDCSLQARKSEKAVEIDLRKLIRRTKDVLQTLDSEDRPHLSRSLIEMEKQRDRLLHGMFGEAAGASAPEKKP